MKGIMKGIMKDIKWIKKAMVLGFSFFIAVLLVKPVGVSTQFSVISGMVHSIVDPGVITKNPERKTGYESTNAYYDKSDGKIAKSIKNPLNYSFIFFLAIPLGAFMGSQLFKQNQNPRKEKNSSQKNLSPPASFSIKEYLPTFISGFFLLYGARMAGGCTSGHMMSGMMQSSVSGFVFAAAVFVVAIPVSMLSSKQIRLKG